MPVDTGMCTATNPAPAARAAHPWPHPKAQWSYPLHEPSSDPNTAPRHDVVAPPQRFSPGPPVLRGVPLSDAALAALAAGMYAAQSPADADVAFKRDDSSLGMWWSSGADMAASAQRVGVQVHATHPITPEVGNFPHHPVGGSMYAQSGSGAATIDATYHPC